MRRSARNRMADLLLGALRDREKRVAIVCLELYCDLATRRDPPAVPLLTLVAACRAASPDVTADVQAALGHLIGAGKMLRLRRGDSGEVLDGEMPGEIEEVPWLVEPEPDVRAAFPAVRERARSYARLVARLERGGASATPEDPLRQALNEAALCFNAGLFFEAHEHLEHYWAAQPKGPTKRFLQGIIQICVGFHHARAGNYEGAVNQLAKGLEKTIGVTGEFFGVNYDAFLPKVAASRDVIVKRGRGRMRPILLSELPRMPAPE